MFFSNEDLNDTKPIPVKDRLEWILGVVLAQYSIGVGLKKFKKKGEAGVKKGLTRCTRCRYSNRYTKTPYPKRRG